MTLQSYKGKEPLVPKSSRVFKGARLIGDVRLGEKVGIWFNAVLRADMAQIEIGEGSNIQDNAVVHTDVGQPTTIGRDVTVGHSAIIHAATIEDGALVGMGSIILNGAVIGKEALVAAGTVVPPGKKVPERTLVLGNPMRIVKELDDEDVKSQYTNTGYYVDLLQSYGKEE